MKNKIFYSIVALALVFGACGKDLDSLIDENEQYSDDLTISDKEKNNTFIRKNTENKYVVNPDGLAFAVINGRTVATTQFILTDEHGNTLYAYCADMELPCYPGSTYRSVPTDGHFKNGEDIKIMAAITYMINNYGWMEISNPHGYRLIIQCVIWHIIHGYEVISVYDAESEIIMKIISHIYDNINDIADNYEAGVVITGEDVVTKDGLFGPYMIYENDLLADVDFDLTSESDIAKFINESGIEITQIKPEEPFYLLVSNDFAGELNFTVTASSGSKLVYVSDYLLFMDIREGDYQPLFHPVLSSDAIVNFYSYTRNFTVTSTEPEPEPEEPEPEKITLTGLSWNNGNGSGINQFTVNGITLKNNKNFVTPANFNVLVAKTPGKNNETAIYTITERTVADNNGKYLKIYDIKVALYIGDAWNGYKGTITVDNPGGNNNNQQVDLERFF